MKLFLVTRKDIISYDECYAVVVAARNSAQAKKIMPDRDIMFYWNYQNLKSTYIGEAKEGTKEGTIIIDSWNNGS